MPAEGANGLVIVSLYSGQMANINIGQKCNLFVHLIFNIWLLLYERNATVTLIS